MPCKAPSDPTPDLSGKVFLVTGGNTGIGLETIRQLATHGAKVYMGARSPAKAQSAIASLQHALPSADIHPLAMDLCDLASVVAAAKSLRARESRLDGLVNNAGIMATPMALTPDGYEAQFQTNYLAHWLLTHHLLPLLLRPGSASARIVNVTSVGHKFAPKGGIAFADINQSSGSPFSRYGQSKLAQILHVRSLDARYGPDAHAAQGTILTAAAHPGNVDTQLNWQVDGLLGRLQPGLAPLFRAMGMYIRVEEAAATPVWAATSAGLRSGSYLVPVRKVGKESREAKDVDLAERLWVWTETELRNKELLD